MYNRIIRNDMVKSKAVTLTTMIFIAAAAMLVSLAAILAVNLSSALDTMMTKAKTPHFMQMHAGELDTERLQTFAKENSNVEEFQVVEFLNLEGSEITLGENTLAASVQDNGFSTQNKQFDYLLDLDGNIINAADGELYVPISYKQDNLAEVGDRAVIAGKEFIVAGFLRDSQMNSTLSASKRFLVSEGDYKELRSLGYIEYLIEFRLKDPSKIGAFETAYSTKGLNANGPTVTYSLFKMMNGISDGMMIGVILLVSGLVVAISFMCIRFTLLAKMEEDYREIGVMKAIGLRVSDIKKIYIAKYAVIATVGSILGFILSLFLKEKMLENIRLYMGQSDQSANAILLGIIGIILIFFSILIFVNNVLRGFRKISASEAIRFGTSQDRNRKAKRLTLSRNKLWNTNIFLGMKDVLSRKRLYITMLLVLVIASFIIMVPQNLYNTISSKSFIQYMGIGNYDLRIQTTGIDVKDVPKMVDALKLDSDVSSYAVLTTKSFQVKMDDGSEENLKVELGDHSIFPIAYTEGRAPEADNEIALSKINADELGKQVGDILTLVKDGEERSFTMIGIYSDITNGGKTAKAVFTDDDEATVIWTIIPVSLSDHSHVEQVVNEYTDAFPFAKVSDIEEFVTQTLGSIISAVEMGSYASIAIALVITILITSLFMNMLLAKDKYQVAVMKAFGFTNTDIQLQYITRSVFVSIIGIVIGTLLANTIGEKLAGLVISSFGASTFSFTVDPLDSYLFSPLMMIGATLFATVFTTWRTGKINISENIKE
ncbi:ABC transporter permease [Oceanobacillus piezotolerans]|uniref:ABC transporter permease n=1 Tax=Oceanobacillus piezotolerans TaxID=2448030 RepID=A0A498DDZ4_9BACI|nr:FtsX-like permease family protein [Oceanobacillus piezotolerans]RLL48296.1 ABC transporter permease [Oceanobacillus piezotolerans]